MLKQEFKKLEELEEKISQLEKKSSQPSILNNPERLKKISSNLTSYKQETEILTKLKKIKQELDSTKTLAEDETDNQMKKLVENEISDLKNKIKKIKQELEEYRASQDPDNKIHECFIEVRAGTGGEEANLFAFDLFRMYTQFCETNGWKVTILSESKTGIGGYKEVIAQIEGKKCYANLKYERGVHRVQRVPKTESSGRIHTSTASVVVFPPVEKGAVSIKPDEIKVDTYRSSGPGGQSVNTTDSAIRITHKPTGIIVTCQDQKSQHKNKAKAMKLIESKLAEVQKEEEQEELAEIRQNAIKGGDRSAKIRTYNFPQSRVTDHRIKESWHNLEQILDGNLEQIIETLSKHN